MNTLDTHAAAPGAHNLSESGRVPAKHFLVHIFVPPTRCPVVIGGDGDKAAGLMFGKGCTIVVKHDCLVDAHPIQPILRSQVLAYELKRLARLEFRVPISAVCVQV
jgi:hypothetical protein